MAAARLRRKVLEIEICRRRIRLAQRGLLLFSLAADKTHRNKMDIWLMVILPLLALILARLRQKMSKLRQQPLLRVVVISTSNRSSRPSSVVDRESAWLPSRFC